MTAQTEASASNLLMQFADRMGRLADNLTRMGISRTADDLRSIGRELLALAEAIEPPGSSETEDSNEGRRTRT